MPCAAAGQPAGALARRLQSAPPSAGALLPDGDARLKTFAHVAERIASRAGIPHHNRVFAESAQLLGQCRARGGAERAHDGIEAFNANGLAAAIDSHVVVANFAHAAPKHLTNAETTKESQKVLSGGRLGIGCKLVAHFDNGNLAGGFGQKRCDFGSHKAAA